MNEPGTPPHIQLAMLSREYVVSRAIHAVANLGIADYMSNEPISVNELAALTDTVPELLERILNFLTAYNLFIKTTEGYTLTPLSYPLRTDHPKSLKSIMAMFNESWWQAFSQLETSLKTGVCAFELQHGMNFFEFMNNNIEKKNCYYQGLDKLATLDNPALLQSFGFAQFKKIITFFSGKDSFSEDLHRAYPEIEIIPVQLDLPLLHPVFTLLPEADAYIFKGILHDFNDVELKKLVRNCYQEMKPGSSFILMEQVIPDSTTPHTNKTMDIVMMVLVNGKQRTLHDWKTFMTGEQFVFKQEIKVEGLFTIMEFQKPS